MADAPVTGIEVAFGLFVARWLPALVALAVAVAAVHYAREARALARETSRQREERVGIPEKTLDRVAVLEGQHNALDIHVGALKADLVSLRNKWANGQRPLQPRGKVAVEEPEDVQSEIEFDPRAFGNDSKAARRAFVAQVMTSGNGGMVG